MTHGCLIFADSANFWEPIVLLDLFHTSMSLKSILNQEYFFVNFPRTSFKIGSSMSGTLKPQPSA